MQQEELLEKLKKVVHRYLCTEKYETLKKRLNQYWFEDNRDIQWASEDDNFQIEINVLDKWKRDDGYKEVYVLIEARDGYRTLGANLYFCENGENVMHGAFKKYKKNIPYDISTK